MRLPGPKPGLRRCNVDQREKDARERLRRVKQNLEVYRTERAATHRAMQRLPIVEGEVARLEAEEAMAEKWLKNVAGPERDRMKLVDKRRRLLDALRRLDREMEE